MSGSHPEREAAVVLVVADGDVPPRAVLDAAWPGWAEGIAFTIAADGGAEKAEACLGIAPDLIVGDGDSLPTAVVERYRERGTPVREFPVAKDESDLELALLEALARAPDRVVVVGALGGLRLDHELAAIGLLAHPALAAMPVTFVDARARLRLVRGPARLDVSGPVGALVSLIPAGEGVSGVTTAGLLYPLHSEPLPLGPARGLSNIRTQPHASVAVADGLLLVIETAPAPGGPS